MNQQFTLYGLLLPLLLVQALKAQEPAVELNDQERKFVDLLTGATLAGRYTIDLNADELPKADRYAIESVRKVGEDSWIITARLSYKDVKLPIPVPVQVKWAGDTPMLQLTDLNIPLLGEGFSSRILFSGTRYAGTWQHGKVGGHMWGVIERTSDAEGKPAAQPNPAKPVEQDQRAP